MSAGILRDELVAKAVGEKLKKEMEMISRTFNNTINKYSFLFDGDAQATQAMLIEACFPKDERVVSIKNEQEITYFNMEAVIRHIPSEMKETLYAKILEQFATKIDVTDLKPDKEAD